jgi:hypothetical protein
MCTRANRASVPDSLHALFGSLVAFISSVLALGVALATAPIRMVRSRPTKHGKPFSTRHVEVQVHVNDGERVRAIEGSCRAALKRSARTWAPFPLPLDRVEVISSAPAHGKADIFEQWVATSARGYPASGTLVVVSIGTTLDGHDLTADEIGGALAAQIQRLVVDRYQREHPQEVTSSPATEPEPRPAVPAPMATAVDATPHATLHPDNLTDITTVRAQIAELRKSQPLIPAGPSTNGVHPEPNPAS